MKLISIAMATYNGEKYLDEQLSSIIHQTYQNLEIIVCDDGSTDRTIEILESYRQRDSRIKIYRNGHNLGFVKNFERAISLCKGEYIALADQDDIWEADKITLLVDQIDDALLIHSDATLIDGSGTVIETSYSSYSRKRINKDIYSYIMENNVTGCTMMFNRNLLNIALPFPDSTIAHDWWLAICAFKTGTIRYIDRPLIRYRQHLNNQIGAHDVKTLHPFSMRMSAFRKTLVFLEGLKKQPFFNTEEKQFISGLLRYYEEFFGKTIRCYSFIFQIRYFRYFNETKPLTHRIAALFLGLFGANIQDRIWRLLP